MANKIYGYVRVSSVEQNEDRQILALRKVNVLNSDRWSEFSRQ